MMGTITVAAIAAINQEVVCSFPKIARSRAVMYKPTRMMIPIIARMRFVLLSILVLPACVVMCSMHMLSRESIVDPDEIINVFR